MDGFTGRISDINKYRLSASGNQAQRKREARTHKNMLEACHGNPSFRGGITP
jgi:hypothetical protein